MADLIDHNGYLALSWGPGFPDREKPEQRRDILISKIRIEDVWPADVVGREVSDFHGDSGQVYSPSQHRYLRVEFAGWESVILVESISKPRNGCEYTWKWQHAAWVKDWFSRCEDCRKYHAPELTYCEKCYRCHKGKCLKT